MPLTSIARVIRETFRSTRQRIGGGGNGEVYRRRTPLGRQTVIKEPHAYDGPNGRLGIETESVTLQDLSRPGHPGIEEYRGHGKYYSYLEVEFIEGETLMEYFTRLSPAARLAQALPIFREVVSAVAYIHDREYVHTDLNWKNVLKTKAGIKIIDFAFSRPEGIWLEAETDEPGKIKIAGTRSYLNPARIRDGRPPLREDDIFALGLMLFELLSGQKAINIDLGLPYDEQIKGLHLGLRRRILALDVPEPVIDLIFRMLGLFGDVQYRNCYEILAALDEIEGGQA